MQSEFKLSAVVVVRLWAHSWLLHVLLEICNYSLQPHDLFRLIIVSTASWWWGLYGCYLSALSQFLQLQTILPCSFDILHRLSNHSLEFLYDLLLFFDGLLVGSHPFDFLPILCQFAGESLYMVVHSWYCGVELHWAGYLWLKCFNSIFKLLDLDAFIAIHRCNLKYLILEFTSPHCLQLLRYHIPNVILSLVSIFPQDIILRLEQLHLLAQIDNLCSSYL